MKIVVKVRHKTILDQEGTVLEATMQNLVAQIAHFYNKLEIKLF